MDIRGFYNGYKNGCITLSDATDEFGNFYKLFTIPSQPLSIKLNSFVKICVTK